MAKITIIDIQHKEFKKTLQGFDRNEVNEFLDEIIETLEDEAQARAALQGEIGDLRERLSHFKAMEESLQSTLLLAQRTADEVKAAAHKEADLIKQEARLQAEREISALSERIDEARREAQRHSDTAEKAKSELRSLLMSHLALIDRSPLAPAVAAQTVVPAEPAAPGTTVAAQGDGTAAHGADTDALEQLPLANGTPSHQLVE
ncbi:MAG TPA: DivIVA domain-containing protein [Candidatus Elarobacter sp.]|jgi:cell division initiation protein|nr:DivIVA domain-containing protein [Candidatus Elarobacter sp.]